MIFENTATSTCVFVDSMLWDRKRTEEEEDRDRGRALVQPVYACPIFMGPHLITNYTD